MPKKQFGGAPPAPAGRAPPPPTNQLSQKNLELEELRAKIKLLEGKINELSEAQMKKERDEARKELQDAKLVNAKQLAKDLETANKDLERVTQEYNDMNGRNSKMVAKNNGLQAQILQKDKDLGALNETLVLKSTQLEAAQDKATRLEENNKALEKEKNDLKSKGGDTSKLQAEVVELMEKIAQNELKINALESAPGNSATNEAIDKIRIQYEADVQKHREQNEIDTKRILDLEKIIEENKASIDAAAGREGQYKIEKAEDQMTIKARDQTITEEQKKYGELSAQLSTDNGIFNAKIKDLEQKIGQDTATLADRDKVIETQGKKTQEDEKLIQDLQGQHGQDQKTIQSCNATIAENQTKMKEQESIIAVNEQQIASDKHDIALITVELLQVKRDCKTAEDTLQRVEDQKKHYIDEYTAKSAELATMTDLKDKLQAQIAAFQTGNTTKVLQDQLDDLFHKKGEVDKKYALLEVEKDDLKSTIDKLTAEIKSLQTQLKNSSTSSHVQGTSVKVKIRTEKERQEALIKEHETLMDTLLKQLLAKVDFPVKKSTA
jgi:chromosome segregation ATPase